MPSSQVLHVDFIALQPRTTSETRRKLLELAGRLAEIEGVLAIGAIDAAAGESYDLVLCYLLPDFVALEPFGTDARYVRFLQGVVAPLLASFSGADVRLDTEFPAVDAAKATCLALSAAPETYDWEVRDRLVAWLGDGAGVAGLAVGEHDRFRGLALAFDAPAEAETPAGAVVVRGRWRPLAGLPKAPLPSEVSS